MKKRLSIIVALLIFVFQSFASNNVIAAAGKSAVWDGEFLIAHGLGDIGGNRITNSKEAFIENYKKGFRLFEADLTYTTDGVLVARHNLWEVIDGVNTEINMPYEEFMSTMIEGRSTPMNVGDLLELLQQYDDAYIITDTKYTDQRTVRRQFQSIVDTAISTDPSILDRIIPQIYHEQMYDWITDIYPFEQIMYTLYQTSDSNEQVIQFAKDKKIPVVVSTPPRFTANFALALHQNGILAAVHTYNAVKDAVRFAELGADLMFTDSLSPSDISFVESGQLTLKESAALYDQPDAKFKTKYSLAPQTVSYTMRMNHWYKINTWLGPKWMYDDGKPRKVAVSSKTPLFANPDARSKPIAYVSPQTLTVVEYGKDTWIKVKTWLGDLWIII